MNEGQRGSESTISEEERIHGLIAQFRNPEKVVDMPTALSMYRELTGVPFIESGDRVILNSLMAEHCVRLGDLENTMRFTQIAEQYRLIDMQRDVVERMANVARDNMNTASRVQETVNQFSLSARNLADALQDHSFRR